MIKLSVPLAAQSKNNTCWHASAWMIWRYHQNLTGRVGPMNTLRLKWMNNNAIHPKEFIKLAGKVGLINSNGNSGNHSSDNLESILKTRGPIWCAGYWYGLGHVIVLTGVDKNNVFLNDPDGGKRKTGSLTWFNEKLASQFQGCMMVKNPKSY